MTGDDPRFAGGRHPFAGTLFVPNSLFEPAPLTFEQKRREALNLAKNDPEVAQEIYDFLWPSTGEYKPPAVDEEWVPEVKTTPWFITQIGDTEFGSAYVSAESAKKVAESMAKLGKTVKLFAADCKPAFVYYPDGVTQQGDVVILPGGPTEARIVDLSDAPGVGSPDINGGQG